MPQSARHGWGTLNGGGDGRDTGIGVGRSSGLHVLGE